MTEKLGLTQYIDIVGYSDKVEEEMREASIFAGTSTFEGFMLVLVEAMSQGCVPISYETPFGPKDIINEGVDGFLIKMHDKVSFAEKLSDLIKNENLRHKMQVKALERSKDFEVKSICKKWTDKYNEILNP